MPTYQVAHYLTPDGQRDLYLEWLSHLRDRDTKIALVRRIMRIEQGNFGDHKFCRDGVWELRLDIAGGIRVYYAIAGHLIVLLLCGGTKRTQRMDIQRAVDLWQDWQQRSDDEKQTP